MNAEDVTPVKIETMGICKVISGLHPQSLS
jgi:hypothetical protein